MKPKEDNPTLEDIIAGKVELRPEVKARLIQAFQDTPPQPKKEPWEADFDEKFVDHEGCQAGHRNDENCQYCRRWGGVEGEPKYDKRPVGTSREIKRFISRAIESAVATALEKLADECYVLPKKDLPPGVTIDHLLTPKE